MGSESVKQLRLSEMELRKQLMELTKGNKKSEELVKGMKFHNRGKRRIWTRKLGDLQADKARHIRLLERRIERERAGDSAPPTAKKGLRHENKKDRLAKAAAHKTTQKVGAFTTKRKPRKERKWWHFKRPGSGSHQKVQGGGGYNKPASG